MNSYYRDSSNNNGYFYNSDNTIDEELLDPEEADEGLEKDQDDELDLLD